MVLHPAHLDGTPGTLSLEQVAELAREVNVPVFVDAAYMVYPVSVMSSYWQRGADITAISAKYYGGPNSGGFLLGREDLIAAIDTQTPQVLIEARIVEAATTYAREIGIQWGGDFTASSATGNPTGLAFPSSIGVAGGATDSPRQGRDLRAGCGTGGNPPAGPAGGLRALCPAAGKRRALAACHQRQR